MCRKSDRPILHPQANDQRHRRPSSRQANRAISKQVRKRCRHDFNDQPYEQCCHSAREETYRQRRSLRPNRESKETQADNSHQRSMHSPSLSRPSRSFQGYRDDPSRTSRNSFLQLSQVIGTDSHSNLPIQEQVRRCSRPSVKDISHHSKYRPCPLQWVISLNVRVRVTSNGDQVPIARASDVNSSRQVLVRQGVVRVSVSTFCTSIRRQSGPRLHKVPLTINRTRRQNIMTTTDCRTQGFNMHSTVSSRETGHLYPRLAFISKQVSICGTISHRVRRVFRRCASVIRPLSLSRTFLSIARGGRGVPLTISVTGTVGRGVQRRLRLVTSTKMSCGGFLTGVTSSCHGPSKLYAVRPSRTRRFVGHLPVRSF